MAATKIKLTQFQGSGKLFTRDADGLASILCGIAIDNARIRVEVAGVKDFTDNSTGTAGSPVFLPLPAKAIDATAAGGVTAADLNTALGKLQNAGKVVAGTIQEASPLLGLVGPSSAAGVVATADTIPALQKSAAAGAGNGAADFVSSVIAIRAAADNVHRLVNAANEVLTAVGVANVARVAVPHALDEVLVAIPNVAASSTGASAVAKTDVDAFLLAAANAYAAIAAAWNGAMNQSVPGALHVIAG